MTVNTASGGGSGTWTAGASGWEDGATAVNWTNGDNAVLAGTVGTITLGSAITAGTVTVSSAYTLANAGFNLSATTLTGSGNLSLTGAGTFTLTGSSTYTGNLSIADGKFKVSGGQLYNAGYTNAYAVTVNAGGTLELDSFAYGAAGGLGQLADYGARRVLNGGTINVVGNSHSAGNNFNVANGSTGFFNMATAGQTLTLSGNGNSDIAVGGTLTFGGAGNITVNETISANTSNGNVIYAGTGTLTFGAFQGLHSVTTVTARTGGTISLNATNLFTGGHGTAMAANRSIAAEGTGIVRFESGVEMRIGNLTLNNGGTITSNRATGGYGILLGSTSTGAAVVTVSGTYAGAARLNGTGGFNMTGVSTFAVADVNSTATDSGRDLLVTMALGPTGTNGGTAGGILKTGVGTMVLNNVNNSFTGNITVDGGTLVGLGASGNTNTSLGQSSGSRTITVNSGATLLASGNNVFGGGSQTLANTIKVIVNGGTLAADAYNVIGNVDLNGGTMTATAGSNGSYQTWEFNGSTVTVGGSSASTISSSAASNGAYHIGGGKTLTLAVADATLSSAVDLTVSAVLTNGSNDRIGNGALLKTGAGTLLLSGSNSYSGGTTVRAGTVVASNANALGTTGTVTLGDASTGSSDLSLLVNATAGGVTLGRAISVTSNGAGVVTLGSATTSGTSTAAFSGAVTLARSVTLTGSTAGGRTDFSGGISGTGDVTIAGTNRVIFLGTANSYAGATTVGSGSILQLSDGSATSNSFIPDAGTTTVNGSLRLAKGGNSETIGTLAGSGVISAIAGADTLIVSDGSFSGAIGQSGGTLALTKLGAGTLTLSGVNTYTRATTVSNGTLSVAAGGSLSASSAVSVASGATLNVAGTVGGTVALAAGSSASVSGTVAGAVTLTGNASLTVAGTVSNSVSLDSGSVLSGAGSVGAVTAASGAILTAGNGVLGTLTTGNLTFAGAATLNIGPFTNYSVSSALSVGALTANGGANSVTVNLGGGGAVNGAYNLVSFTGGSIGGTGLSAFVLGTQPTTSSRQTPSLEVNGGVLQYVVTGATPYWSGEESDLWTTAAIGGAQNWKLDTDDSGTEFLDADAVLFNDLATGTTARIDGADVNTTSVLVTGFNDFTITGTHGIASGSLAMSGYGSLTLGNANTYAGGTTLSSGRIRLGAAGALGSGALLFNGGALSSDSGTTRTLSVAVVYGGDVTLGDATDTGALTLSGAQDLGGATRAVTVASDVAISGVVSNGGLTKAGNGTLELSGANTYSSGTTIQAGVVRANDNSALGTGSVTVSGGSLDINGRTLANAITLSGGSLTGVGTLNGALNLGGSTLAASSASDLTLNGAVSNGAISKSGAGVLTLAGSNTFSGGVSLSDGTLRVGSSTALGNGTLTLSGGRLSSDGSSARSLANSVSLAASTTLGDATRSGALTFSGGFDLGGNGPVLTTDSAVTLSGVVSNGTLRKSGNGTLTLSGANTYTGGTVVNAGVLEFSTVADGSASNLGAGSGATGFISLVGGTLRYTGSGAVTSGRSLFFDQGTGTIDVSSATGSLTLNGGGTRSRSFTKAGAGTLDLTGAISGTGTLTVDAGTLVLRTRSTYTGATTVNSGELVLSTENYGRALSSSAVTVKTGATLTLTGVNIIYNNVSDTLPVIAEGGTIRVSYSSANGHNHFGLVTLAGGTLTGLASAAPYNNEFGTLDNTITVNGSARSVISGSTYSFALNAGNTPAAGGFNDFVVGSTGDASGVDLLVSAILSGVTPLRKTGSGVMRLSAGNTFTGGAVVNGGVLSLALANSAAGTLASGVTVNSGGTLRLDAQDALGYTTGRGAMTVNSGGTITISSGFRATVANTLTMTGGTLAGVGNGDTWGNYSLFNGAGITATSDASGNAATISAAKLALQDNGGLTTFAVSRGSLTPASDLTVTGAITQMNGSTNGLRKTGTGVMTLQGANTYVGSTTVDNGVLRLASGGRLYSGAFNGTAVVTVNSGATVELENWAYGETSQSLGGLRNAAAAFVVNGGTVRMAAAGTTAYGRGITVNSGGATLESLSGANWVLDGTDGDVAFVYNGNPNLTLAGAGDGTFGKAFSGSGSLTKSGAGTWILGAASTYSGGTTISGGTLSIGHVSALGTGSVVINGGFLDLAGLNPTNVITLAGGGLLNAGNWAPATVTVTGNVSAETINNLAASEITLGTGATVDASQLNPGKTLVLTGAPTLTGLGSFSGTLAVAGALDLSSAGNRPGQNATLEVRAGGSLNFGSGADFTGTVAYKGGQIQGSAFKGTLNVADEEVVLDDANLGGSPTVLVGTGASVDVANFTGSLRLAGTGAVAAGLTSFTGSLELTEGAELNLTTADAPNADVVVSDGTLRGSGSLDAVTLAAGGTLAPGNSPGIQNLATLTLTGGNLDFEILNSGGGVYTPNAGTDYDTIVVSGLLDISALSLLNRVGLTVVSLSDLTTAGDLQDFDPAETYAFDLISYGSISSYEGSISQFFDLDTTGLTYAGFGLDPAFLSLVDTGSAIRLTYAPIPEPSTYGLMLGGLALAGAALRRRKKNSK